MSLLASEWIKLRSLRSIPLLLAAGFLVSLGLAVLSGLSIRAAIDDHSSALRPDFDALQAGFAALFYGQVAFVAFGAVAVSSEFTSGTIRSSLAAVPHRSRFYLAKIAVVAMIALPVTAATAISTFLAFEASLGSYGVHARLGPLAGAVAYLTLLCVLSAAVAAVLRGSALTLGFLITFLILISPALSLIRATRYLSHYLPDQAGMRMMTAQTAPALTGLALVVGWTVIAVLAGLWSTKGRDM